MKEWYIIDGIGPFFRDLPGKRMNWSKIPFTLLEQHGGLDVHNRARIAKDFKCVAERAAEYGFNAITLDDLAHLTPFDDYPDDLKCKIDIYREWYRELFEIAAGYRLDVLMTTDLMFSHPALDRAIEDDPVRTADFLGRALDRLFSDFPQVKGVIFRFGEADAIGTRGNFHSRLALKTARQARRLVQALLPVFERHRASLIFRTWSVGIYPIGDLIWNRNTFDRMFARLPEGHLYISMKYGESDFFRYLPLNQLFFRTRHPKLIELQARREYEGFGRFPSFVGWDYAAYARSLKLNDARMGGAMIWCQTGGWGKSRQLTFLESSSLWNEINTYTALRAIKHGDSAEEAIRGFCRRYLPEVDPEDMIQLLKWSEEAVKELLYIDEFAKRKIFFRRLRIPPLITVFWDRILINHALRKILQCFVDRPDRLIRQGYAALDKVRSMRALAARRGLPDDGLDFMEDTFALLAEARKYYFLPYSDDVRKKLKAMKKAYKKKYGGSQYSVATDFSRVKMKRTRLRWIVALLFRYQRGYRLLLDQIFTVRLLSVVYPLLRKWPRRWSPKFARKQAMGIESVFK